MKKFVLALLSVVGVASAATAQDFTMQKDTVKTYAPNSGFELYNYISNKTSGNLKVDWRVISHTLPAGTQWVTSFGLCDNVTCYSNSVLTGVNTQTTDDIAANGTCPFKLQYGDLTNVSGGPYYITAELRTLNTTDTVVFQLNKFATNVSSVSSAKGDNIVVYPNPARDEINVVFDRSMDVKNITVYNLIGKAVTVYRVSGNSAKLDIQNIPSGIYFLRMLDAQGHVLATRKFTHQ